MIAHSSFTLTWEGSAAGRYCTLRGGGTTTSGHFSSVWFVPEAFEYWYKGTSGAVVWGKEGGYASISPVVWMSVVDSCNLEEGKDPEPRGLSPMVG